MMAFLYVFVLLFNVLFPSREMRKNVDVKMDGTQEMICGGPGGVNPNAGGPDDNPPIWPELP
uniref:Uncharacterized protein n=1 Tax=candidate division WOR-3 bacterium TaxID=2052148 RepID=A0A7C4Y5J2_UNCW3